MVLKLACGIRSNDRSRFRKDEMNGEGIKEIWEKIKELTSKAGDIYSGELGTALRNALPDTDSNARPGFVGEKHAILKVGGKPAVANWMGPGTQVLKRIKRGDPARSYSDGVAKIHDIQYALSGGDPDKVRAADERMINKLKNADDKDDKWNVNLGLRLMQAKNLAEDLGALKKGSFAGNAPLTIEDRRLLEAEMAKAEAKGYGNPVRVGGAKQRLLMKAEEAIKEMEGKGLKRVGEGSKRSGEGSANALTGYGSKRSGEGARMAGGALMSQVMDSMIPMILKTVSQKAPGKIEEVRKILTDPRILGALSMFKGSGKWPKQARDLLKEEVFMGKGANMKLFGDLINRVRKIVSKGEGYSKQKHKKIYKLMGKGLFSDIVQGAVFGWNKAKALAEKIPVVGEVIKKIPAVPGGAETYDELLERTGHKLGVTQGPAFPWSREEWDKMSGKAKKFVSNWYQKELQKYRDWLTERSATAEGAHIPRPELSPKPSDAEIQAINESVARDPLVKFAKKVPKAKLDSRGKVIRDSSGVAVTGSGRGRGLKMAVM